ncbi:hypothetical protein WJX77_005332 [Trebouxia sp. C0004]
MSNLYPQFPPPVPKLYIKHALGVAIAYATRMSEVQENVKFTRGERSHLRHCCFNGFDQGNRLTGQENAALLEVTGGHGSIMVTPGPFRSIAVVTREATFSHLECLLRCIWLECCGHLSSFKVGHDPMPNKHPGKLVQQTLCTRCPPSERDSGMEQLDNEKCHDTHDEGLGRPEVRRQMHEIATDL